MKKLFYADTWKGERRCERCTGRKEFYTGNRGAKIFSHVPASEGEGEMEEHGIIEGENSGSKIPRGEPGQIS